MNTSFVVECIDLLHSIAHCPWFSDIILPFSVFTRNVQHPECNTAIRESRLLDQSEPLSETCDYCIYSKYGGVNT